MFTPFWGKHVDSEVCSIEEEFENHGFSDFLLYFLNDELFAYRSTYIGRHSSRSLYDARFVSYKLRVVRRDEKVNYQLGTRICQTKLTTTKRLIYEGPHLLFVPFK